MDTFLKNLQQGGRYSDQIFIHQAELSREEFFWSEIIIYICLKNWLLEFGQFSKSYRKSIFLSINAQSLWRITSKWKIFKQQIKYKDHKKSSSSFNLRNSNNKHNERNGRNPNTCFRCEFGGSLDCRLYGTIKSENKFHWNTEKPKTCAYR